MKKYVNLLRLLVGFDLKTIAYMALPIYWAIIITGTFFTVELKVYKNKQD